jgi:hypothetical protein
MTHPIAHDPCAATSSEKRGLASCDLLKVKLGDACGTSSPDCYLETSFPDGHTAISDYLVCRDQDPGLCMTR